MKVLTPWQADRWNCIHVDKMQEGGSPLVLEEIFKVPDFPRQQHSITTTVQLSRDG